MSVKASDLGEVGLQFTKSAFMLLSAIVLNLWESFVPTDSGRPQICFWFRRLAEMKLPSLTLAASATWPMLPASVANVHLPIALRRISLNPHVAVAGHGHFQIHSGSDELFLDFLECKSRKE